MKTSVKQTTKILLSCRRALPSDRHTSTATLSRESSSGTTDVLDAVPGDDAPRNWQSHREDSTKPVRTSWDCSWHTSPWFRQLGPRAQQRHGTCKAPFLLKDETHCMSRLSSSETASTTLDSTRGTRSLETVNTWWKVGNTKKRCVMQTLLDPNVLEIKGRTQQNHAQVSSARNGREIRLTLRLCSPRSTEGNLRK